MFQGLEGLAWAMDSQQVVVECTCVIFWRHRSGTSIFLFLHFKLRFTIFAWIYSTFYLVKSSGIFTGIVGTLPVKQTSNYFSDRSTNFLSSASSLKWLRLNWNYWTEIKLKFTGNTVGLANLSYIFLEHFVDFDWWFWSLQVSFDHIGCDLLELSGNLRCN